MQSLRRYVERGSERREVGLGLEHERVDLFEVRLTQGRLVGAQVTDVDDQALAGSLTTGGPGQVRRCVLDDDGAGGGQVAEPGLLLARQGRVPLGNANLADGLAQYGVSAARGRQA